MSSPLVFGVFVFIFPSSNLHALTSIEAFSQTVHPITKAYCIQCHSTNQLPYHANPDATIAHNAVVNNGLVDFTTTTNSKLFTKVKGGHHCWSGNCANDAQSMLNQINNWKSLISSTTTTTATPTASATSTSSSSSSSSTSTSSSSSVNTNKLVAYKIYNRLAGVPPRGTQLTELESLIASGKKYDVAMKAMDDANYYNITLKNWVKPWTNVDRTNRVVFNDYVATVIGIVRDNIPFDQVIYGDHLYIGSASTPGNIPVYDKKNNNHYQKLEDGGVNLKDYLVRVSQSKQTGIKDTAGVLTSRAAGSAFYSAGTNRRATRFTFMNFMCRDFEALHDINVPDYHVRRDVDRKPGADSRTYRNKCVGCHAGQDALGGAFAYFDFVNNELVYTEGKVVDKINKNVSFLEGWVTKDDSFENLWASGQNADLGWPEKTTGNGVRELGIMLSRSRAFAECMSTRVYELVCLRSPTDDSDKKEMKRLADIFQKDSNFNMKNLMAETAVSCVGE